MIIEGFDGILAGHVTRPFIDVENTLQMIGMNYRFLPCICTYVHTKRNSTSSSSPAALVGHRHSHWRLMNHADWIWHWMHPQPIIQFKERMNTVSTLSHASTSKRMKTHRHSTEKVQHGTKVKWETWRMGWCWFPSLNVYGITHVFQTIDLALN
jgi:hypothetical protein